MCSEAGWLLRLKFNEVKHTDYILNISEGIHSTFPMQLKHINTIVYCTKQLFTILTT